jgi:hypothetical protein
MERRRTAQLPACGYGPEIEEMSISALPEKSAPGEMPDAAARWSGILLLLTAVATAVIVYTRVVSDTDQGTLPESLRAVAGNPEMCGLFGAVRITSGLTLLLAGWFLLRTWIIRDGWATPLVPYLFVASGICTSVSGACAVLIAFQADPASASIADVIRIGGADNQRWLTGEIGFTGAGLALIVAAWFQWRVGGILRKVAPASAALGVVMSLIWVDTATIIHPVMGGLFFVWLLVIGAMLASGQVERRFTARYGPSQA